MKAHTKALIGLVAGTVVGSVLVMSAGTNAGAGTQPKLTVNSTEGTTYAGRKLDAGAPLATIKPPYPEECGLGLRAQGENTSASPFAGFCDVIPLSVSLPAGIDPQDDVRLTVELTWALPVTIPPQTANQQANPSSNLDLWLWDNKQAANVKNPVPAVEGTSTKWTPADAYSEYTLLKVGTSAPNTTRPVKVELESPTLNQDANGVNYNVLVLNVNSSASGQQPNGPCPQAGGVPGCYVLKAKMQVTKGQGRTEKTEPTTPETPFRPPSVPTTLPALPPPGDLPVPQVAPDVVLETAPIDFGAVIQPHPDTVEAPPPLVLGAVETNVDPLLESIKASNLDEELEAPQLEVAVSEEPPPIPPSGTAVAVSMVALPILAAVAAIAFLIRRRRTFRLT